MNDFTFTFHFHALEKEMANQSSVLAWRIPGMTEPGGVYGVAQSRTQLKQLSSSSSRVRSMGTKAWKTCSFSGNYSRVGKICWRRDRLPTPVFLGFTGGSAGKESACNVGDLSLIPGLGRSPGEGKAYPPQYSGLENSMDYSMGSQKAGHD